MDRGMVTMTTMRIIGLDCGRTELRGIVSDQNGRIQSMVRIAAGLEKGVIQYIRNIQSLVNTLMQSYDTIDCVGVASSGRVDVQSGLVSYATIPGYRDTDLRALVQAVLDIPVFVENSARAALLGEHWLGAARNANNVVLLWLGQNVSGATMIDGKIHQGSSCRAGEWGHMQIAREGEECVCGQRGCLDQFIGGKVLTEKMEQALGRSACPEEYLELYRSGNPAIHAIFEEFSDCLAQAVGNIERIEDPELVLLGGPSSQWYELFWPLLQEQMESRRIQLPVKVAQLGADAGCLGAVYLGLESLANSQRPLSPAHSQA